MYLKIKELKRIGNEKLKKNNIEDEILKTSILLQYILNMNKTDLILNNDMEVSKKQEEIFLKSIEEMIKGKPLQYITNKQEFMKLNFFVDENVLIPQPDTEILVESTIEKLINIANNQNRNNKKDIIKLLDLCTGSGAIAVSVENSIYSNNNIFENIQVEIYASDISKKALEIAKKNAISNNKNTKISFILSNIFENIKERDFDIIVSNPPYIETKNISKLSKEVQSEPHLALDGGEDGLDFYRIIAKEAKKYLKQNGHILLEIGYNQRESVINIFKKEKYLNIRSKRDLSGNDRVIEIEY